MAKIHCCFVSCSRRNPVRTLTYWLMQSPKKHCWLILCWRLLTGTVCFENLFPYLLLLIGWLLDCVVSPFYCFQRFKVDYWTWSEAQILCQHSRARWSHHRWWYCCKLLLVHVLNMQLGDITIYRLRFAENQAWRMSINLVDRIEGKVWHCCCSLCTHSLRHSLFKSVAHTWTHRGNYIYIQEVFVCELIRMILLMYRRDVCLMRWTICQECLLVTQFWFVDVAELISR